MPRRRPRAMTNRSEVDREVMMDIGKLDKRASVEFGWEREEKLQSVER